MSTRVFIKDKVESLAFRVKTAREEMGLTQPQLAKKAGISDGHLSKIETGKTTNPTRQTVKKLANALEVPEAYLLAFIEATDEEDRDDVEYYMMQSPLVRKLLDIFIQLPLRDQKLLVSIAQTMAETDRPRIIGDE